jgi:hypothetical protein
MGTAANSVGRSRRPHAPLTMAHLREKPWLVVKNLRIEINVAAMAVA